MISGEGRNSNNTFSSDEEAAIGNMQFPPIKKGGPNPNIVSSSVQGSVQNVGGNA
jgi:hypothetical protein